MEVTPEAYLSARGQSTFGFFLVTFDLAACDGAIRNRASAIYGRIVRLLLGPTDPVIVVWITSTHLPGTLLQKWEPIGHPARIDGAMPHASSQGMIEDTHEYPNIGRVELTNRKQNQLRFSHF